MNFMNFFWPLFCVEKWQWRPKRERRKKALAEGVRSDRQLECTENTDGVSIDYATSRKLSTQLEENQGERKAEGQARSCSRWSSSTSDIAENHSWFQYVFPLRSHAQVLKRSNVRFYTQKCLNSIVVSAQDMILHVCISFNPRCLPYSQWNPRKSSVISAFDFSSSFNVSLKGGLTSVHLLLMYMCIHTVR